MANFSSLPMHSKRLPPEIIWLEPEQMEQAKTMSKLTSEHENLSPEALHWHNYLNALSLLGFEKWLSDRLSEHTIERLDTSLSSVCYVQANGFKFCLMAVEHMLDEIVYIPQSVVQEPGLAAHFYVLHEVSEEQQLVTLRGILRFDELIECLNRHNFQPQDSYYQLPFALMDAEPNHLTVYCRSLHPAAIPLPTSTAASTPDPVAVALVNTTTKLTQWLQDRFDQNWQAIDQLINPEAYLLLGTRSLESVAKRGKLINLGVQFGQQAVALLVNVTPEADEKLSVLVQLHPTGEAQYLSSDLKLSLRSWTGKVLQEVTSRRQDNYIQLKSFKGKPGKRFKVAIHLGNESIEENFEL